MGEGVVADHVVLASDLANYIRPLQRISPDYEKRCADIVPGQNLKQSQRVRLVRPVVKCQCDLL